MQGALYFLFFLSGVSGLIYQVVWVRVFGNVFGNTVYSTSLVVAVFMLGLGVGGYVVGVWADRQYLAQLRSIELRRGSPKPSAEAAKPDSLLRVYGYVEVAIALLGSGITWVLPHLDRVSALVSAYARDANGWNVLSVGSHLARAGIALVLLFPITLLMGGTLTLLIRQLVRREVAVEGRRIAMLYGMNTAGAALGCVLTDFALVPFTGLRRTQMIAVLFNVVAAAGAFSLASRASALATRVAHRRRDASTATFRQTQDDRVTEGAERLDAHSPKPTAYSPLAFTSLALALSGFAAMGMEIVWFRHLTILLGGFRAVFSLLLTIILIGIGVGSLLSGLVLHRDGQDIKGRALGWFMVVQALFVVSVLFGLATADSSHLERAIAANPAYQAIDGRAVEATVAPPAGWGRILAELWFNAKPMLWEVMVPALLMGFAFPLGNAIVQRAERSVGRHAGVLYLANTVGAVCGSLIAGFVLLPYLGIQATAATLALIAELTLVPLHLGGRREPASAQGASARPRRSLGEVGARGERKEGIGERRGAGGERKEETGGRRGGRARERFVAASAALIVMAALGLWFWLPSDHVINRAFDEVTRDGRLLARSEGLTEVIAVTEAPGQGRTLITNGHAMSSTARFSQRYMRAMAHIPLLSIDRPETVLVIGFGVGNTTHAATLHPSVRRVEVADLSRDILAHARFFSETNRHVLNDPRVVVYVNDGRHHLQMQPSRSYDLITLEPPPIGYAGVASLYSREFYTLAHDRLKPRGYVSQWLPAYQVPTETTLAMVRAFIEVFPQTALISGAEAELLLLGVRGSRIEIDPDRVTTALASAPAVLADLQRIDLGSVREIVGTFVGSFETLVAATRMSAAVSDDRPLQEYGVRSLLNFGEAVPGSIVDLTHVTAWCPMCFVNGEPAPAVEGLDIYLRLLDRAYRSTPVEFARARSLADRQRRVVAGSAYLGAVVPESADLHNVLGIELAQRGAIDEAIAEFREALRFDPESAATHWHLGAALASRDQRAEAMTHLRRSIELDPTNGQVHYDLAVLSLQVRQLEEAIDRFRAALRLMPSAIDAHTNLGVALALKGQLDEAIDHFQQALKLDPAASEARRHLATALRQVRQAR